jgi:hypothetical protein
MGAPSYLAGAAAEFTGAWAERLAAGHTVSVHARGAAGWGVATLASPSSLLYAPQSGGAPGDHEGAGQGLGQLGELGEAAADPEAARLGRMLEQGWRRAAMVARVHAAAPAAGRSPRGRDPSRSPRDLHRRGCSPWAVAGIPTYAAVQNEAARQVGFGRIVALYYCSATLYQIH